MKFLIKGEDQATTEQMEFVLEAPSAAVAEQAATSRGIKVHSVELQHVTVLATSALPLTTTECLRMCELHLRRIRFWVTLIGLLCAIYAAWWVFEIAVNLMNRR